MGLTINNYPFNNVATVENVYANIRDIKTTKRRHVVMVENENEEYTETYNYDHVLEFIVHITKDENMLRVYILEKVQDSPFTGDIWGTSYTVLKEDLTANSLTFVDNI
jgi:hypothetical protein